MLNEGIILLLENSADVLFQLDHAFRSAEIRQGLRVARYGNEAILYLKGIGIYGDREHYPLPNLIIINTSIPDGSAWAVYGWVRRNPEFSGIPIILLNDPDHPTAGAQNLNGNTATFELSRDNGEALAHLIKNLGDAALSMEGVHSDPDNVELIS